MGRADDLRAELEKQRGAFRAAVEAAADRWETAPADEGWSPRQAAEHVLGGDVRFANRVAQTMQSREVDLKPAELATAADALAALDEIVAATDRVYRYVEDSDLQKPVETSIPNVSPNIEGMLQLAAHHFSDHANQVGGR